MEVKLDIARAVCARHAEDGVVCARHAEDGVVVPTKLPYECLYNT